MDTTAGEDFMGLCDQKRSYQQLPDTESLRIYDDLKTLDKK
jgi:hypothetical protein